MGLGSPSSRPLGLGVARQSVGSRRPRRGVRRASAHPPSGGPDVGHRPCTLSYARAVGLAVGCGPRVMSYGCDRHTRITKSKVDCGHVCATLRASPRRAPQTEHADETGPAAGQTGQGWRPGSWRDARARDRGPRRPPSVHAARLTANSGQSRASRLPFGGRCRWRPAARAMVLHPRSGKMDARPLFDGRAKCGGDWGRLASGAGPRRPRQ